jgi:hypothetical protein
VTVICATSWQIPATSCAPSCATGSGGPRNQLRNQLATRNCNRSRVSSDERLLAQLVAEISATSCGNQRNQLRTDVQLVVATGRAKSFGEGRTTLESPLHRYFLRGTDFRGAIERRCRECSREERRVCLVVLYSKSRVVLGEEWEPAL